MYVNHNVYKSVSSTKEQLIMKERQSKKLNESVENAQPESVVHYQILLHRLALLANDSLDLKLVLSAIKRTHQHTHKEHPRNNDGILKTER